MSGHVDFTGLLTTLQQTNIILNDISNDQAGILAAIKAGIVISPAPNAASQSQPSNPTAPASTSVYAMQGLAGSIVPVRTGNMLVVISGTIVASTVTAADGIEYQLSYGTGVAPANAATITGTQVGQPQSYRNPAVVVAADVAVPFSVQAVIKGATIGVAYWLDLAAKSLGTVSSGGLSAVSVSAIET